MTLSWISMQLKGHLPYIFITSVVMTHERITDLHIRLRSWQSPRYAGSDTAHLYSLRSTKTTLYGGRNTAVVLTSELRSALRECVVYRMLAFVLRLVERNRVAQFSPSTFSLSLFFSLPGRFLSGFVDGIPRI